MKNFERKNLRISFNQNEVDTIEIFNHAMGNVAKLKQHLLFVPSYGYSIKSKTKNYLFKRTRFNCRCEVFGVMILSA